MQSNLSKYLYSQIGKMLGQPKRRFWLVHGIILVILTGYLNATSLLAETVSLDKNFERGAAAAFEQALTSDVDTVILSVKGGYLSEGMAIGRIIRQHRLRTIVPVGAACLSACAEAFLGGTSMQIDGSLAFHIPRDERRLSRGEAFDQGLAGGTMTAIYRFEMGFGFDLTRSINRWTTNERLLVFESAAELLQYKGPRSHMQLPRFYQN